MNWIKRNTALFFLFIFFTSSLFAQNIYVSPNGNNSNSGTIDAPLETLSGALDKVKGSAGGATIWLRKGIYNITNSISLTTAYSGTTQAPLVVKAYPGEKAILNGGLPIPVNKFRILKNTTRLNRLPAVARGKVYVAQLLESRYYSRFPSKEEYDKSALLSWNGYVMNEAQYPNRGYGYIEQVIDEGPSTRWLKPGEQPPAYSEANPSGGRFTMRDNLDWNMMEAEFKRTHDMLIRGYFHNDWFFQTERIGNIQGTGEIQLLRYTRYGIVAEQKLPRRVNIYGALCQLDEPGEWYFDKAEKLLYYWPVEEMTEEKPIIIGGTKKLIECTDRLENVRFENLIFENFGDHGLRLTNAGNVKVLGCEFRSGNGVGCRLQGDNNLIQSCDFHDLMSSFVLSSSSSENVKNLVNENNAAINNHIYSIWNRGYGGCAIGGVGTRFAHNLMHDTNGALKYGENDCVIEYNEFYNMGYEMGDWNPMYRGADFTSLGNQVRYNFVHHLMETPYGYPIAGIRNDDQGHGLSVHHNIFFKAGRCAVMFKGANNCASHNIVVETKMMWWSNQVPYEALDKSLWDSKGDFMARRYQEYLDKQAMVAAGTLNPNEKDNFLGRAEIRLGKEFWTKNDLWRKHYPIIDSLYHFDDPDRNPWMQCYDTLINNVMVNGSDYPFHMHGPNKVDEGGIESLKEWLPNTALVEMPEKMSVDQIFNDWEHMDISIKESFDAIDGFHHFDMNTIGLFIDEYRTEMPDKETYRMAVKERYRDVPSFGGAFDYDKLNERYSAPDYLKLIPSVDREVKSWTNLFQLRYASDNIVLYPLRSTHNARIEVYRITGEKVLSEPVSGSPMDLGVSNYPSGIYLVKMIDDDGAQSERFIVR